MFMILIFPSCSLCLFIYVLCKLQWYFGLFSKSVVFFRFISWNLRLYAATVKSLSLSLFFYHVFEMVITGDLRRLLSPALIFLSISSDSATISPTLLWIIISWYISFCLFSSTFLWDFTLLFNFSMIISL